MEIFFFFGNNYSSYLHRCSTCVLYLRVGDVSVRAIPSTDLHLDEVMGLSTRRDLRRNHPELRRPTDPTALRTFGWEMVDGTNPRQ